MDAIWIPEGRGILKNPLPVKSKKAESPQIFVFKSQYLRRGLFDFAPFGSGALWVYLQEMYSNKVVVGPYIFNLEIGIPQPLIARLYAGALSFTVERSFLLDLGS